MATPKKIVRKAKALPVRKATKAETRALAKLSLETEEEEEESDNTNGAYEGEDDFYVTFQSLQSKQTVVCFEQAHQGSAGIAIAKIIENINPEASFQALLTDHVDKEYKYFTLLLATN